MAQQAQAPQDGTNTASAKEAVFISLFVISFVLYCLRIWSHTRPVYKLDTSDHVISLAMVMISYQKECKTHVDSQADIRNCRHRSIMFSLQPRARTAQLFRDTRECCQNSSPPPRYCIYFGVGSNSRKNFDSIH